MKLVAYKCIECGHFTISSQDGIRCAKCGGVVTPVGEATNADVKNYLTVNLSIKDMDIFKRMIGTMAQIANDEDTPERLKAKIKRAVERACRGETEE